MEMINSAIFAKLWTTSYLLVKGDTGCSWGGTPSALAANRRVEIFVSKKSW